MLEKKTEIKNTRGKTEIENAGRENRDRKYQRRKQRQKILEEKTEIENDRGKQRQKMLNLRQHCNG